MTQKEYIGKNGQHGTFKSSQKYYLMQRLPVNELPENRNDNKWVVI